MNNMIRLDGDPNSFTDAVYGSKSWSQGPLLFKEFIRDASWLLTRLELACRTFASSSHKPKVRVFVDRGDRTDLAIALAHTAFLERENIEGWMSRAVGATDYCVAFNGVTAWDEDLAEFLSEMFVRPLVQSAGLPLRGFDAYVFSGRYDMTPFGIHRDEEHSILIHLGPGKKEALIWPNYRASDELTPFMNQFNIEQWRESALQYILEPGDVLYIPTGIPHVMTSNEFSVTLGVIPNPCDHKTLMVEIAREVVDQRISRVAPIDSAGGNEAALSGLVKIFEGNPTIEKCARDGLKGIELRLRSNGFLVPPPTKISLAVDLRGVRIRLKRSYSINYVVDGEFMRIYARGYVIKSLAENSLMAWLDSLKFDSEFQMSDVCAIMGGTWEELAIETLLMEFIRLQALEVIKPE